MKVFNANTLLNELKEITTLNHDFVNNKLTHFSESQLNWRPNSMSWNCLEVLAHLNEYATFYNQAISERIAKTKFTEPKETFVSSPLGRSAWRSMKLGNARNIKRKFKAPKSYNPTLHPELVSENEVGLFLTNQTELITILDEAKKVNLRKVKVPISISKIVRLRLGDALMFVIYHNERHIEQLKSIIKHPNFPKKK